MDPEANLNVHLFCTNFLGKKNEEKKTDMTGGQVRILH